MLSACRKAVSTAAVLALLAGCGGGEEAGNTAADGAEPADNATAVNESASVPPSSPTPEPVFTSLARRDCRVVDEKREEAGYARYHCPGRGEWVLELVEADGREDLAPRRANGAATPLQLPSTVARGAFNRLGETVEWIGADRLIIRYDVEQADGRAAVSSLLVVDLGASRPCVVGQVSPGGGQNQAARRIAEAATLPPCRAS